MIHTGDCLTVMRTFEADSVDAICTDPPYGLEFMGKGWDAPWRKGSGVGEHNAGFAAMDGAPDQREGNRGGSWFGSREGSAPSYLGSTNPTCRNCGGTQNGQDRKSRRRCKCDAPDFPNTIIPRQLAFQAWCTEWGREALRVTRPGGYLLAFGGTRTHHRLVCGLEDAGWIIRDELDWIYASGFPKGKANLKPAHEPIVLARKPGPLQPLAIDECRITACDHEYGGEHVNDKGVAIVAGVHTCWKCGHYDVVNCQRPPALRHEPKEVSSVGRWPSNVLLSDPELFDEPNPWVVGSGATARAAGIYNDGPTEPGMFGVGPGSTRGSFDDSGGYSRFFIIPKADRSDREPTQRIPAMAGDLGRARTSNEGVLARHNKHPTVKPVDLMRHLIRLVTPPGGTVLDCFAGSGSTLIAAELEGFPWIGIEKEPSYVAIAEARLNGTQRGLGLDVPAPTKRRNIPSDEKLAELGKTYQGHATFSGGWGWEPPDEEPAA